MKTKVWGNSSRMRWSKINPPKNQWSTATIRQSIWLMSYNSLFNHLKTLRLNMKQKSGNCNKKLRKVNQILPILWSGLIRRLIIRLIRLKLCQFNSKGRTRLWILSLLNLIIYKENPKQTMVKNIKKLMRTVMKLINYQVELNK